MQNRLQMIHLYFIFKSIDGLSHGKWSLTQIQVTSPTKLFLIEKIKKFIILCYVLRTALSRKPQIKNTLEYFLMLFSCCLILLTFEEHLKVITTKANKTIGLLSKLQKILPRPVLMTIYKAFERPHLDCGDVIYDEVYNQTFHQKLESVQYSACLALSGATRGSSR